MNREKVIKDIESYHKSLGNQSGLTTYIDNAETGNSLDTISDAELYVIREFMEDDYADL